MSQVLCQPWRNTCEFKRYSSSLPGVYDAVRRQQPDKNIIKWISAKSKTNRVWLEKNGCGEDFRRSFSFQEHGHMINQRIKWTINDATLKKDMVVSLLTPIWKTRDPMAWGPLGPLTQKSSILAEFICAKTWNQIRTFRDPIECHMPPMVSVRFVICVTYIQRLPAYHDSYLYP